MHTAGHSATADNEELRERLRQVYWLGGGSGAGKSTIAGQLAKQHGLELYATDKAMGDHAARSSAEGAPQLSRFAAMDMDERWVNRSPESMLETFHWFLGEGFGLILADLLRLPPGRKVIVEGFRLLPALVEPVLALPSQAVWLLPTPDFRRAAFDSRGSSWDIPNKTSDPVKAMYNLHERDRLFTERLRHETARLSLQSIEVDTSVTETELLARVTTSFEL